MRRIILDLETTGSRRRNTSKICEIAAIEFDENYLPCSYYHQYVNPVHAVAFDAYKIHGLTNEFLSRYPRFHVVADSVTDYLKGAEIYAHAASNDRCWLDNELQTYRHTDTETLGCDWVDTLKIAQQIPDIERPGIDGLCDYYGMDESFRFQHSALTDCALLLSILPLIEGHEDQGWEPEDICDWLDRHQELNKTKQFSTDRHLKAG